MPASGIAPGWPAGLGSSGLPSESIRSITESFLAGGAAGLVGAAGLAAGVVPGGVGVAVLVAVAPSETVRIT
ncbi:MAG: hypothetical protein QM783_03895 [Phycisphaerales bacterium]